MIVGILSGERKRKPFSGNELFFQRILCEIEARGGTGFVFTPSTIFETTIDGYFFEHNKWKKKTYDYPNVVYNRLPSRKAEESDKIQVFFDTLQKRSIPYFNQAFLNKWETYKLLKNVEKLDIGLPDTELLTDSERAFTFLKDHSFIYVKPVRGNTGQGIFTLTYKNDKEIVIKTQTESKILTKNSAYKLFSMLLQESNMPHILQRGIKHMTLNNLKYDFRILLIKPSLEWKVIGIGIRATNKNNITTHVMRGGSILDLTSIRPQVNVQYVTSISKQIASKINERYRSLKECSLDIGRDGDDNLWLFEVNTKPMSFDEEHIESQRIIELVNAFEFTQKSK